MLSVMCESVDLLGLCVGLEVLVLCKVMVVWVGWGEVEDMFG